MGADRTRRETMLTPDDDPRSGQIKAAARSQWTDDPAGAVGGGGEEVGSPEWFAQVERFRYEQQSWMHSTFRFERFGGRRVLEIGVGLGTDHLQFARAGADMTGIDLTPRCVELTRRRLSQEGVSSDLQLMDAERLTFADDSFDVVYSFGVLHHTASADRAFAEVRRVLRPGGVFLGGLYNRHSAFVAVMLAQRVLDPAYRGMSFEERLGRVEYSSQETSFYPYIRLFTGRELTTSLRRAGFRRVKVVRRHVGVKVNRPHPRWMDEIVGRTAGWYLAHEAI